MQDLVLNKMDMNNSFFLETTKMIGSKLYMNDHLIGTLQNIY
jgi:hypothetical protein